MKRIFILPFLAFSTYSSIAQWNNNTDINLEISGLRGDPAVSASTSDGKTWIAYYAPVGGNYHMRAQLLDRDGYKLLGEDGVVVNDYPSGSATYVYNICLDAEDNLVVGMQDLRDEDNMQTVAYKIDQTGKSLWNGGRGVILGEGFSPNLLALKDGSVLAGWSDNSGKLSLQKINVDGTTAWSNPRQVSYGSSRARQGQFAALSDSGFVMIYQSMGRFGVSSTPYAQRFNKNGDSLWSSSVQLSSEFTSAVRYYSIIQDADTVYFGFYSSLTSHFNSWLQRINPDGTLPYGATGVPFSDYLSAGDPNMMTTNIALAPNSPYVWAVCSYTTPGQTDYGIYVQKFEKATGKRLLGDYGKEVYPISPLRYQQIGNLSLKNDAPLFLFYSDQGLNYFIKATLLDTSGNFYIPGNDVLLSSSTIQSLSKPKMRQNFTALSQGQSVATWTEDRGSGYHVYAQNFDVSVYDTSIVVSTEQDVDPVINVYAGTLQLTAAILPQSALQDVTWEIIPVTGEATISTTGLVTAVADGTVWAKAVSVAAPSYADSVEITISNQEQVNIGSVIKDRDIDTYPNPAGDVLFVVSKTEHVPVQLRIMDISGKVLQQQDIATNGLLQPLAIVTAQLAQGIYLLELKGEGLFLSRKIVKH